MQKKVKIVRLLFFIILAWIFFSRQNSFAQRKKVETFYDQKRLIVKEVYYVLTKPPQNVDSLYVSYYQNGNIKSKGYYEKGKADGPWEYYYENGNPKMKGNLKDNSYHGLWTFYFENGNLNMEGEMKNGQKDGDWKHYYENGNVKSQGFYKKDRKEGLWKYFYEEGIFKAQTVFYNDKGKYTEVYPNGAVKCQGDIVEGKSNGIWKYYYEDGKLKGEGQEKDGVKEGMWKFYHPNGKLMSEGVYNKGKAEGNWKYYYDNGALSSEGSEKNGKKEGYWKLYYKNGSLKGEGNFIADNGDYKEFYESGKLKVEGQIQNGKNHGMWKYYYENGALEGSCFFNNGQGKYTGFYESGKMNMEGTIIDGNKVGIWKLFKEDGSIAGYYKTYYENDVVVFREVPSIPGDTLKKDSLLSYEKPKFRLPKKKSRYFSKKVNEFQSIILSSNPFGVFVSKFPINLEYYFQERLGYEVNYTLIRSPFFMSDKYVDYGDLYKRGFSAHIKQKFYQKDEDIGMFYLAHEIRFTNLNNLVRIRDSTSTRNYKQLKVDENLLEYSVIFGDRIMKDATQKGWTIDIFVGVGLGLRLINKNWTGDTFNSYFAELNTRSIAIPFRFGINLGYAFKKSTGPRMSQ